MCCYLDDFGILWYLSTANTVWQNCASEKVAFSSMIHQCIRGLWVETVIKYYLAGTLCDAVLYPVCTLATQPKVVGWNLLQVVFTHMLLSPSTTFVNSLSMEVNSKMCNVHCWPYVQDLCIHLLLAEGHK